MVISNSMTLGGSLSDLNTWIDDESKVMEPHAY